MGYADDTGATSVHTADLERIAEITHTFAREIGQELNIAKSRAWSTEAKGRAALERLRIDGVSFAVGTDFKCLGAHLRAARSVRNSTIEQRFEIGISRAKRIAWTHLPFMVKSALVSSLVVQASLYGIQSGVATAAALQKLQSVCLRAVWGLSRKSRAKELVFTLLLPGHRTDPKQALAYQCLKMLRDQCLSRPDVRAQIQQVWRSTKLEQPASCLGPVGLLFDVLGKLGWKWEVLEQFERPGRAPLPLFSGPDGWWLHELRDGLRLSCWRAVARRRQDCAGIDAPAGVDKHATLANLKNRGYSCGEQGILRSILSGSLRTRDKLYRAGLVDSPICIFCGLADETLQHMWWHCPAWDSLRLDPYLPSAACRRELPPCTQHLGIAMEDDECVAFQQREPRGAEVDCPAVLPGGTGEEKICAGRIVAWTDGACANNQDARFRRAGAGVFYCKSSARNRSIALSGREQTNQRAELLAVVHVLRSEQRAVEIRTDSEYVHNGAHSWQRWAETGRQGDHKDLWSELASLLKQRPKWQRYFRESGWPR